MQPFAPIAQVLSRLLRAADDSTKASARSSPADAAAAARDPGAPPPAFLIDAIVDAYVDWGEEAVAVERAYRQWDTAPVAARNRAFTAYVTAIDLEELAARRYEAAIAAYLSR